MSNVFPPGLQLGQHYRVVRLIQSGSLSAVYEAEHLVSPQRAALKWLRFSGAEAASAVARVQSGALAAKLVVHPNVVRSLEVVREGSSLFLVSELLSGESLQALLSPHLLPRRERIRLLIQALRGVSAAHALGVVHGGLHPGNIFLANVTGETNAIAKVLDFGTSQLCVAEHAALGFTQRSHAGTLGPHVYMSPEQVTRSQPIDARSDVYSLAVVAYQALTGRLPYTAENAIDLAVKFATTVPLPAAALCPELPGSLDRLLSSSLARNPESRPDTLSPLIDELEAFQPLSSLAEQPYLRGAETALIIQRRPPPAAPRIEPQVPVYVAEPAPAEKPDVLTVAAPTPPPAAPLAVSVPARAAKRSRRLLAALAASLVLALVALGLTRLPGADESQRPPPLPRLAKPAAARPEGSLVRALTATLSGGQVSAESSAGSHDAEPDSGDGAHAQPSDARSERRRLRAPRRARELSTPLLSDDRGHELPFRAGRPPRKDEF